MTEPDENLIQEITDTTRHHRSYFTALDLLNPRCNHILDAVLREKENVNHQNFDGF